MSTGTTVGSAGGSLQPWVIGTTVSVGLLSLMAVVLRFLARWKNKSPLGIDDYLIAASMVRRKLLLTVMILIELAAGYVCGGHRFHHGQ